MHSQSFWLSTEQVSTAAVRQARRGASAPPCCTLRKCVSMSTVSVINWWPMTITSLSHWLSTAPNTVSHSRGMVAAQENLNDTRNLTMPLSGTVCHPLATVNSWPNLALALLVYFILQNAYPSCALVWRRCMEPDSCIPRVTRFIPSVVPMAHSAHPIHSHIRNTEVWARTGQPPITTVIKLSSLDCLAMLHEVT